MKKTAIALLIVLCLALCSCSAEKTDVKDSSKAVNSTAQSEEGKLPAETFTEPEKAAVPFETGEKSGDNNGRAESKKSKGNNAPSESQSSGKISSAEKEKTTSQKSENSESENKNSEQKAETTKNNPTDDGSIELPAIPIN